MAGLCKRKQTSQSQTQIITKHTFYRKTAGLHSQVGSKGANHAVALDRNIIPLSVIKIS